MPDIITGIGKGLREPVYPFREAYAFGAELNAVNADGWNAIPVIWDSATSFDLSALIPGHEMAIVLAGIGYTYKGTYQYRFRWYRESDNALLYEYSLSQDTPLGGWAYAYSFIGYVPWEINENGNYRVEIEISGAESFTKKISFKVTGIPKPPVEVPIPVKFIQRITEELAIVASLFYSGYIEVKGWIWPFNLFANVLYLIAYTFDWLVSHFIDFGIWVNEVTTRIEEILSSVDIISLLKTWLDYAENAWAWVKNAPTNVTKVVDTWWKATTTTVQGWIDIAKEALQTLINNLTTWLTKLQAAWDSFKDMIPSIDEMLFWFTNWWAKILVPLTTWWNERLKDINKLINDTLKAWLPFYDELALFFKDPQQYVYNKLDEFFERFW